MSQAALRKQSTQVFANTPARGHSPAERVSPERIALQKIADVVLQYLGIDESQKNLPSSRIGNRAPALAGASMDSSDVKSIERQTNEPSDANETNADGKREVGSDSGSFHFTTGVIGPEFCNRFAKNMDFDMTVLWIAAWCRRDPGDREGLFDELEAIDGFSERLTKAPNTETVQQWRSSMVQALNSVSSRNEHGLSQKLSLGEITTLLKKWNSQRLALLDENGSDLLDRIDDLPPELLNHVIVTLMDSKEGKGSLFTKSTDQYPMWKALNIFRHWSTIGREDKIEPHHKAARVSKSKIKEYLSEEKR